jgi:outer membrane protein OmpA-like peptidoglycan-associated protein
MTTGVNRLKELLFDTEAQRLDEVQRRIEALASAETARHAEVAKKHSDLSLRIDAVFDRAGTEERLQKSVASILDGALRDAEVTKHDQLSQAVAPLVVKTIKYELKNSQDDMVDALYPITGRLVKQYVQTAMADLMADINKRLGGSKPSELEARANAMGLTVPELILAEQQELKVDELFLVRRGSGDLVAHWERPVDGAVVSSSSEGSNRDVLIAGYLSGITAFSEEAFDDKKGSLRSLDMDGERIFVRASPAYLLAARCSGSAPHSVEQIINDEFVRVLGEYQHVPAGGAGADAVDGLLPNLATSFEQRFKVERDNIEKRAKTAAKPAGFGRLYGMAALVVIPLIAWLSWSWWQNRQADRVVTEARIVLAANPELKGFPLSFGAPPGGYELTVTGLAPNEGVRDGLLTALKRALPGTAVLDKTGLLPVVTTSVSGPDLSPQIEALRRDLAAARDSAAQAVERLGQLSAQLSPVPGQVSSLQSQLPELQSRTAALGTEIRRIDQRIDGLPSPVASAQPVVITPRERLAAFLQSNAIFFANGVDFIDEAKAAASLDQLAALIMADDSLVRVVGYTDERGTTGANAQLAQSRAERVAQMLYGRGVPRDRISVLGRSTGPDLSRNVGLGSPNRRVQFEIGFVGEPMP